MIKFSEKINYDGAMLFEALKMRAILCCKFGNQVNKAFS